MDYVEWVDVVARTFAAMRTGTARIVGLEELRAELGLGPEAGDAIYTALRDLDRLGIVDLDSVQWIKETDNTRRLRGGARLEGLWPPFFERYLEPDEEAFLSAVVASAHRPGSSFADVEWVEHTVVFDALGWDRSEHSAHDLANVLEKAGFAQVHYVLGPRVTLYPTYDAVVRVTRRVATEWQARIGSLVDEWETTTVEFKRELPLGTPKQNAEFAHDVIALANTKSSGSLRFLIIGFDSSTRRFAISFARSITQDRLEQILNTYTRPTPDIHLYVVPDVGGTGDIGVVEVRRDRTLLPHRMVKGGGKITVNDVFVRHGAHVVKPDAEELADLEAEGALARSQEPQ